MLKISPPLSPSWIQDKSAVIAENMHYVTEGGNKHISFPEFIPKW